MAGLTSRPVLNISRWWRPAGAGAGPRMRSYGSESLSGRRLVSATARRYAISRSLLTTWRRQFQVQPLPGGEAGSGFVPAVVLPEGPG
jgi:hypothetical protein